jgi:hypothetical protein
MPTIPRPGRDHAAYPFSRPYPEARTVCRAPDRGPAGAHAGTWPGREGARAYRWHVTLHESSWVIGRERCLPSPYAPRAGDASTGGGEQGCRWRVVFGLRRPAGETSPPSPLGQVTPPRLSRGVRETGVRLPSMVLHRSTCMMHRRHVPVHPDVQTASSPIPPFGGSCPAVSQRRSGYSRCGNTHE